MPDGEIRSGQTASEEQNEYGSQLVSIVDGEGKGLKRLDHQKFDANFLPCLITCPTGGM